MRYVMALCIFLTLNGCDVGNPMRTLEGAWKFKTERFSYPNNPQNNYIMSGNLIIGKMVDGELPCKLSVTQRSELRGLYIVGSNFETNITSQKCKISRNENAVTIISEIIESSSDNYLPDNFELRLHGDTMKGRLTSGVDVPVTFVKSGGDGGFLPATLWDVEREAAIKELGDATYFFNSSQGCVHGIKDIRKSDNVWRKAKILKICDGELNGQSTRSEEVSFNINCENLSVYFVSIRTKNKNNILVEYDAEVFGDELLKFGPYGYHTPPDTYGDLYRKIVQKTCA